MMLRRIEINGVFRHFGIEVHILPYLIYKNSYRLNTNRVVNHISTHIPRKRKLNLI